MVGGSPLRKIGTCRIVVLRCSVKWQKKFTKSAKSCGRMFKNSQREGLMMSPHLEGVTRIATSQKGSSGMMSRSVASSFGPGRLCSKAEWPEGAFRDALGTTKAHIVTRVAGIEQGIRVAPVGQAKPLFRAVRALHYFHLKRWASRPVHWCVRGDQSQQLFSRHHALHLIKQHLLVRAPGVEIKVENHLFRAANERSLRASVRLIAVF